MGLPSGQYRRAIASLIVMAPPGRSVASRCRPATTGILRTVKYYGETLSIWIMRYCFSPSPGMRKLVMFLVLPNGTVFVTATEPKLSSAFNAVCSFDTNARPRAWS